MVDPAFGNQTESQLKLLSEISAICATIECRLWLRGGWAIDFLLGKVTRPHEDIDLIALDTKQRAVRKRSCESWVMNKLL